MVEGAHDFQHELDRADERVDADSFVDAVDAARILSGDATWDESVGNNADFTEPVSVGKSADQRLA